MFNFVVLNLASLQLIPYITSNLTLDNLHERAFDFNVDLASSNLKDYVGSPDIYKIFNVIID